MLEDNGKQNLEESYPNKYQKHIPSSYGYKLVCVDDKFSLPFKTYLGEDAVYNVINSMVKERKYCSDMIKTIFTKNLWWLNETMKILRTPLNITGNHWKTLEIRTHRDFNINLKLNHIIFVMFHNLKQYDFHLIMHELGKFNLKFLNLKILNSSSKFFIR